MKRALLTGLIAASGAAQAAEIYNNGSLVDGSGLSIVVPPARAFGFTSNASFALADDFTVPGEQTWNVASLDFFAFQTGAVGYTFLNVAWRLVAGADVNAGALVASGTTALTNAGLVGYRVAPRGLTDRGNAIYRSNADVPDFALGAGQYWVTWALSGSSPSGPFVPPVSLGTAGANGAQGPTGGPFAPVIEVGTGLPAELPFAVNGSVTVVPEPSALALMLAGGLAVMGITRRRKAR